MSSRKRSSKPKLQENSSSAEQVESKPVESKRSSACPKCGKNIFWLDFSGQTYGGSYSFDMTHTFSFTCPECHYVIYQLNFRVDQKDLKPTTWTVREENKGTS